MTITGKIALLFGKICLYLQREHSLLRIIKLNLNIMVKQVLLALAIVGSSFSSVMAQEKVKALCFRTLSGNLYLSLERELDFNFETADQIKVSCSGCSPILIKASDMSGFVYVDVDKDKVTNGVVLPTEDDVFVEYTPNGCVLSGLTKGERISVISVAGLLVKKQKAGSDGKATVKLSDLPNGIYMIKAGNRQTIKIQKS